MATAVGTANRTQATMNHRPIWVQRSTLVIAVSLGPRGRRPGSDSRRGSGVTDVRGCYCQAETTSEIHDLVTSYIDAVGDGRLEDLPAMLDPDAEFIVGDTTLR